MYVSELVASTGRAYARRLVKLLTVMPITNEQEETEFLVKAYAEFRAAYSAHGGPKSLAPYNHLEVPDSTALHADRFTGMVRDYLNHLANDINRLSIYVAQLESWMDIYLKCDDDEKICLMMDLIEPIAVLAFNSPATIRSRFIFAASHISHQANRITVKDWGEDNLPKDGRIDFETMARCSRNWPAYPQFLEVFETINEQTWVAASQGFRNKLHHRMPPRFEMGHTQFVKRNLNSDGGASYDFGATGPISLTVSLEPLALQRDAIMNCFDRYSELVRQQLQAINVQFDGSA